MYIIAGQYKNRKIITPKGDDTRPTSSRLRESLFNICQTYIEDADFLDLFAGSGSVGFEALSRGARHATFVENNREAVHCINKTIESLGIENQTDVRSGDVFAILERLTKHNKSFDIIYADPPYDTHVRMKDVAQTYGSHILDIIDKGSLLKPKGSLFIEEAGGAIDTEKGYRTLILRSSRKMGRSVLHEFIKSEG